MPNKKKKENRKKNVRVATIDIQGSSLPQQILPLSSAPTNPEAQDSLPKTSVSLQGVGRLSQVIASNRNPSVKDIIDTITNAKDPTPFINAQLKAAGFHLSEKGNNWVRNTTTGNSSSVMEISHNSFIPKSKEECSLTSKSKDSKTTSAPTTTSTKTAFTAASSNKKSTDGQTQSVNSKSCVTNNTMMCHPTNTSYSRYNPEHDKNHDDVHDEDDDDDNDDDEDDEDHVVGVCLHCGMSPPLSSSLVDLQTNLDLVVPCSATTSTTYNGKDNSLANDSNNHKDGDNQNLGTAPGIQVSCDECHSFICTACHWCHEYQANHEIRVCDRCDAFYCKGCDEMDQCEDCGEVVCDGCGALCSCKFCGCGLCGDCATACGR